MHFMRTTVTLEPDVARLLNDHARQTRKSFKETLNDAVRLGLSRISENTGDFTIDARPMKLKAGHDGDRFTTLLDDLEADACVETGRKQAL